MANQRLQTPPGNPHVTAVWVDGGPDVADGHIVEHAVAGDLVVTQDIPLAALLVPKRRGGARSPRGRAHHRDDRGAALDPGLHGPGAHERRGHGGAAPLRRPCAAGVRFGARPRADPAPARAMTSARGAILLAGGGGPRLPAGPRGQRRPRGTSRSAHAVVPAPPSPSEASVFLSIDNLGLAADTLTAARSPEADSVLLHEMVGSRMQVAASARDSARRARPARAGLLPPDAARPDPAARGRRHRHARSSTLRAPGRRRCAPPCCATPKRSRKPPRPTTSRSPSCPLTPLPPALSLRRAGGLRHRHRRRPPRRGRHRQPAADLGPARDERLPDHVLPGKARPQARHRRAADHPGVAGHRGVRGGNAGGGPLGPAGEAADVPGGADRTCWPGWRAG